MERTEKGAKRVTRDNIRLQQELRVIRACRRLDRVAGRGELGAEGWGNCGNTGLRSITNWSYFLLIRHLRKKTTLRMYGIDTWTEVAPAILSLTLSVPTECHPSTQNRQN